jgi:esterase
MVERAVPNNGVVIWSEDFGDPSKPTCLLVMGYGTSSAAWSPSFVDALTSAGYHVIRYDNRDTGTSSSVDYESTPYTLSDMAADGLAVMDAYGVERAHVIGLSMGGFLAQVLAIEHPERLLSLTIISSSPSSTRHAMTLVGTPESAVLPPPEPAMQAAIAHTRSTPVPASLEDFVKERMLYLRAMSGLPEIAPLMEAEFRATAEREFADSNGPQLSPRVDNHGLAIDASPADRRADLRDVRLPTLVVHGTVDPIFPYPHAVAIAEAIPGAELLRVEGMAHGMGDTHWSTVSSAVVKHLAASMASSR